MLAERRPVPGRPLVRIQLRHAHRLTHSPVQLLGQIGKSRFPCGLGAEVGELFALQQSLPVQDVDTHDVDASLDVPGCPIGLRTDP